MVEYVAQTAQSWETGGKAVWLGQNSRSCSVKTACDKKGDWRKVLRTGALEAQQDTEKSQLQIPACDKV